ncbi:MAG: AAA family ATPase [Nitrosomonadales bacterium]|nr:AAA family ATPase [Nitrosomonadales bacterium]
MYQSYFGLSEAPFSIAPDPRYLYMSQRHQEALAHLLYGVNAGGGFVLLTGEVGAGKTTVCRCFLEQIPESCDVAYIFNPRLTVAELLATVCAEFGIAVPAGNTSVKVYIDCINAYLLNAHAQGRHTVLIIDEAQNLSADVLEQLRLLTNLETGQRKLLQIILLGQPELAEMLAKPELRQLAQRIIARYHLGPLDKREVAAYVQHRLVVAGAQHTLFPAALMGRLYRLSRGIPRIINVLCDRALLGTYAQGRERVDGATLKQAAHEVLPVAQRGSLIRPLLAGLLLASTALAAARYQPEEPTPPQPITVVKPAAARPVAALPDALEWPDAQPLERNRELAYAALFKAWGADFQSADYHDGDECRQAEAAGLRCYTARGWLDELRRLNMPAVLLMKDAQGREFDAALSGVDERSATFVVGGEYRTVALGALAQQWSGHYTLLWRMPPVASAKLRSGDYGPDIGWLAGQLAQLEGKSDEVTSERLFDEAVLDRVKQFQLAHGLVTDGRVGLQTMMHLVSATDSAAPKLYREQGK